MPRPRSIKNDKERKVVAIDWLDGRQTETAWEKLRWACPCAMCQGEMGVPGRLSQISELSEEEMRLESLRPVGNYGIGASWQDGHDTGIYTYPQLRALGDGS